MRREVRRLPEVREEAPKVREVREAAPEVREMRKMREPAPEAHFVVRKREVRGRGMPYEILLAATGGRFHCDPLCFGLRRANVENITVRTACDVCCKEVKVR